MPISTFDGFIAAAKNYISLAKLSPRVGVVQGSWTSVFDVPGNPGAGVLAGTSTAAGVVPNDATPGCPDIAAFGGGAVGYLAQVDFGSSVACRLKLMDMLFKAGAYGFATATTNLAAQPSYASRMPGGSFGDTQIWIEASTAFVTGTAWTIQIGYTNQAGVSGRLTVAQTYAAAALALGRMYQLPLQAGDAGIQKIDSVIITNGGTAMTAGALNVLVMRPLWSGRVRAANDGDVHDLAKTGMPVLFTDTALALLVAPDSTSTGIPELELVIANA
jgi:hypothetical protein